MIPISRAYKIFKEEESINGLAEKIDGHILYDASLGHSFTMVWLSESSMKEFMEHLRKAYENEGYRVMTAPSASVVEIYWAAQGGKCVKN